MVGPADDESLDAADVAVSGTSDRGVHASAGLIGTVAASQKITVLGGCSGTTLSLGGSTSTPVVNDGTIVLGAPAGGSDGIIAGGELDNHGTLDSVVGGALPLANRLLVPLVNESGARVELSGGELEQTTGSATINRVTVGIAAGATWLVQAGSFTNSGTLAPQIASRTRLVRSTSRWGARSTRAGRSPRAWHPVTSPRRARSGRSSRSTAGAPAGPSAPGPGSR